MSDSSNIGTITIPGEPAPTDSGLVRTLTIIASVLTAASIAVNLLLHIARFLKKRPVQPDQRDKIQAAALGLTIMRQLPGLVKQVRLLADQLRRAG